MNDDMTKAVGFSDQMKLAVSTAEKGVAVRVTNALEHAKAGEIVEHIREIEKALEAEYKAHPIIIQARMLQNLKTDLATKLELGRKTAKRRQMEWEDAQERIRQAEEKRLADEAKKRADEEALRIAQEAQDAGDHETAAAVLTEAIQAPAPVVVIPKTAPKTAGRRMVPKFRIDNAALIPTKYLMPDLVKIGGVIRALKSAANIPGISYYEEAA